MIHKNELRKFEKTNFQYRERPSLGGALLSSTNIFRCIAPDVYDPGKCGMEVRAEPYPNPCQPPSAGYCWFTKEEWLRGTKIEY